MNDGLIALLIVAAVPVVSWLFDCYFMWSTSEEAKLEMVHFAYALQKKTIGDDEAKAVAAEAFKYRTPLDFL